METINEVKLKWHRTSEKKTFELNGAIADSNKINGKNHQNLIIYGISTYNLSDNKDSMCKSCKNHVTIFIGTHDCIYNWDRCAIPIGSFPTLREAKEICQSIENNFISFILETVS